MDARTFAAGRSRRFGTANPTRMDVSFWHHMVRTGEPAYVPRHAYDPKWSVDEPVWSFHRFGPTRTPLPDGRVVCIGGEHEDHYDPDFCIYNDVIVVHPDAKVEIFGYPKDLFPPIDFHTATLCDDRIIIVGGLGYLGERGGEQTPVFSLDMETFAISRLATAGPSRGWIYLHQAELSASGRALRVWDGKVIHGQGRAEKQVRSEGAADLDLSKLKWQPASLPDPDPLRAFNWPYPWEPIRPKDAGCVMHRLLAEAPLRHPLFAANVRPLAEHHDRTLFQMLDGTGRVVIVTLTDQEHHATPPEPLTTFYDGIYAALAAIGDEPPG